MTGFGIATFALADQLHSVGGMTRQDSNPLRVYLVREHGHPTTKVIGGVLLAIRLIAGSHSPLEIIFPSIVSEPVESFLSFLPDLTNSGLEYSVDTIVFPSLSVSMWSSLRAH